MSDHRENKAPDEMSRFEEIDIDAVPYPETKVIEDELEQINELMDEVHYLDSKMDGLLDEVEERMEHICDIAEEYQ